VIEVRQLANHEKPAPIAINQLLAMSGIAQFATMLMQQGMAMPCMNDGFDADGRHRYRLMTPEEVVGRAVAISDLALAAFAARGWSAEMPRLDDLIQAGAPVGFRVPQP
jgi:hypothetical protein